MYDHYVILPAEFLSLPVSRPATGDDEQKADGLRLLGECMFRKRLSEATEKQRLEAAERKRKT